VLGLGAVCEEAPPLALVPYQFSVPPVDAVADRTAASLPTQYAAGLATAGLLGVLTVTVWVLAGPTTAGLLDTTRILYDPAAAPAGTVAEIAVPLVALPIAVVVENAPVASESCAVNVFEAPNVPLVENVTVTVPPGQMLVGLTDVAVMVCAQPLRARPQLQNQTKK
jgi:hypothetical protein